ncbi:MAG: alkaline phosphatase family protein, partial [Candidatus Dojkabacteria bacterium]
SIHLTREMENIAFNLENIIFKDNSYDNTLILICADHGQVKVDNKTNIYLNEKLPELNKYSYELATGQIAYPIGSPRDYFFKVRDNKDILHIQNIFQRALGSKYLVLNYEELVNNKIIIDSDIFRKRFPDIAVLPKRGHSIFINDDKFSLDKKGHHGGLTDDEMFTPLISISI